MIIFFTNKLDLMIKKNYIEKAGFNKKFNTVYKNIEKSIDNSYINKDKDLTNKLKLMK